MLKEKIQEDIEEEYQENTRSFERSEKLLRVSDLPYCVRKNYYLYTNTEQEEEENTPAGVFLIGNMIHQEMKKRLKKIYPWTIEEKTVECGVENGKIIGHIDVWTKNEIIEIKSCKRIPKEPYEHHILQVQLYLAFSTAQKATLIYVEKNTFELEEYEVQFNSEKYEKVMEKIKKLVKALEKKLLPEKDNEPWECIYCRYRERCEKNVN